ncbi:unnamed protein product, partial [Rotaria sp. Silwood1]
MKSIITLLEQLVELGNNPKYCCQKPHSSSSYSSSDEFLSFPPVFVFAVFVVRTVRCCVRIVSVNLVVV